MSGFDYIHQLLKDEVDHFVPDTPKGRVIEVSGTVIKAIAPKAGIGDLCLLRNLGETRYIRAEVVGFEHDIVLLMPMDDMSGLSPSTEVISSGLQQKVPVGPELRGRVLNAMGEALDTETKGELVTVSEYPVLADPPPPLSRQMVDTPIAMGIKAMDGFLTCGKGQRMGIFAAAGVGKSVLLEMMVKHAQMDIIVVALIGERGREVREFIEHALGPEGMKNTVVIVATSDRPSVERARAAYVATAVAEYFRDQGLSVLLLMDSMTRFARALREIGLAAGEPPTRRGYPASVFATLPKLMERAGNSSEGSITALYTILVEGDDMNEPVADEVRSILDGHIILSRDLAAKNHYPAIDILSSLSRSMRKIVSNEHQGAADKLRRLLAKYNEAELLLRVGEYKFGIDLETDEAINKIDAINSLLQQAHSQYFDPYENMLNMINLGQS